MRIRLSSSQFNFVDGNALILARSLQSNSWDLAYPEAIRLSDNVIAFGSIPEYVMITVILTDVYLTRGQGKTQGETVALMIIENVSLDCVTLEGEIEVKITSQKLSRINLVGPDGAALQSRIVSIQKGTDAVGTVETDIEGKVTIFGSPDEYSLIKCDSLSENEKMVVVDL